MRRARHVYCFNAGLQDDVCLHSTEHSIRVTRFVIQLPSAMFIPLLGVFLHIRQTSLKRM